MARRRSDRQIERGWRPNRPNFGHANAHVHVHCCTPLQTLFKEQLMRKILRAIVLAAGLASFSVAITPRAAHAQFTRYFTGTGNCVVGCLIFCRC